MKTHPGRALLAALAVIALAVVVAACGGSDDDTTAASSSAANAADVTFMRDMTVHHQSAIDMANVARKQAQRPQIRELAGAIIAAQQKEIDDMKDIRTSLENVDDGGGTSTSRSQMNMDDFAKARPFDRAFIDMMVPHHQDAITMARQELAQGQNPRLRTMAREIVSAQTKEIAQMREWRKAWYGSAGTSTTQGGGSMDMDGDGSMDMG